MIQDLDPVQYRLPATQEWDLLLKMLASRKLGCHFPLCCRDAQRDTILGTTLNVEGPSSHQSIRGKGGARGGRRAGRGGGGWCGNIYTQHSLQIKHYCNSSIKYFDIYHCTAFHNLTQSCLFFNMFHYKKFNTNFICNCQGKGSNYCQVKKFLPSITKWRDACAWALWVEGSSRCAESPGTLRKDSKGNIRVTLCFMCIILSVVIFRVTHCKELCVKVEQVGGNTFLLELVTLTTIRVDQGVRCGCLAFCQVAGTSNKVCVLTSS